MAKRSTRALPAPTPVEYEEEDEEEEVYGVLESPEPTQTSIAKKEIPFLATTKGLIYSFLGVILGSFVALVLMILLLIPLGIFEVFTVYLLRFLGVHV